MSNVAIRAEGLGKQYRIGAKQERYRTLRDTLSDAFTAPFKRARSLLRGQAYGAAGLQETIWALKDVSFEIKHGEVVGIIGRNGAGKSTLLKILSRITEPTEGYADVYGRVGSLLEVGTGFHLELTGRENIYLNGAILGMGRKEIDRKFDEIVDFAEVEKFIDTPVKHYSSGMYLRLAFAVAAHLEPELLVVDEVLAVGDTQFQKKCLGKMSGVAGEGRTVLFVSHNMAAVRQLCTKGLVLDQGRITSVGTARSAVEYYLQQTKDEMHGHTLKLGDTVLRSGVGGARIRQIRSINVHGTPTNVIDIGMPFQIWLEIEVEKDGVGRFTAGLEIQARDGTPLLNLQSSSYGITFGPYAKGAVVRIGVEVPGLPLQPGEYLVEPWIKHVGWRRIDHVHWPYVLKLESAGHLASERDMLLGRGYFLIDSRWSEIELDSPSCSSP